MRFSFLFLTLFSNISLISNNPVYWFIDQKTENCCPDGTQDFPFSNLSQVLQQTISDTNGSFILELNDNPYDFSDYVDFFLIFSEITIISSSS